MVYDDTIISLLIISISTNLACFMVLAYIVDKIYAIVKHKGNDRG